MTTTPKRLDIGHMTHPGMERTVNEDSYALPPPDLDPALVAQKGLLYLVADGMGGHLGGQRASQLAVQRVMAEYYRAPMADIKQSLDHALRVANAQIYQEAASNPSLHGMGTTMVAAVIHGNRLVVANVGDSRAYLLRRRMRQITQDHSLVDEGLRAGMITPQEAAMHPYRGVITRALGGRPDLRVDYFEETLRPGDIVLLCSDGLSNLVDEREMIDIISRSQTAQEAAQRLVAEANRRGAPDNVTAVVVGWGPTRRGIGPLVYVVGGMAAAALALALVFWPWLQKPTSVLSTPTPSATAVVTGTAPLPTALPTSPEVAAIVEGTPTGTLTPVPISRPEVSPTTTSPVPPVSPTPTATSVPPTATPTPKSYPAPTLVQPEDGYHASGSSVQLQWNWEGKLEADEHFDIRVWPDESTAIPIWVDWSDERSYRLDLSGLPERFYWSVRVIRGHYEDGEKVFGGELSPDSERWRIEWSKPQPRPTKSPPTRER